MQAHAGLLLAERLHLAEQNFLFGGVERVTPVFFRTVSLTEVQIQCVAQSILLHVIVSVDVEPVIVLIGTDKCAAPAGCFCGRLPALPYRPGHRHHPSISAPAH